MSLQSLGLRLSKLVAAGLLCLALAGAVFAQETRETPEPLNAQEPINSPSFLSPENFGETVEEPVVDEPAPCGNEPIAIARMQWPSSALLAHIHALVLSEQLGCEVSVVSGDLVGTVSSMATTGQPAIAPEVWVTRIAQIWNSAIESQRLRPAGSTFAGSALEGWFVPQHLAARFPELITPDQLRDVAFQLQRDDGERLTFISCPPDWACAVINRNLIEAHGLSDVIDIVEPANRFELDTLIAQSVSRNRPVVFYYWQPNSVLAQFEFRELVMGVYNTSAFACLARRNCPNPEPSGFVPETVFIVIPDWVHEQVPLIGDYLIGATMPLKELNELMAWQAENDTGFEEAAEHFVATRREVWENWVPGF